MFCKLKVYVQLGFAPKFRNHRNFEKRFGQFRSNFSQIPHNFGTFGSRYFPEVSVDFGRLRNFGRPKFRPFRSVSVVFLEFGAIFMLSANRSSSCKFLAFYIVVWIPKYFKITSYKKKTIIENLCININYTRQFTGVNAFFNMKIHNISYL